MKTRLECLECGKTFLRSIDRLHDVECPKCGGVDIDIASSNAMELASVKKPSAGGSST